MQNKKRGGSKKSVLILISVILILSINIVSAERLPTVGGDTDNWGTILNEYLTQIAGPNATTLNITGNAEIIGDLHMGGALTHDSPVEIREGLSLTNESNFATFTIYNAHGDVSNVSDAFANALIFQSDEIDNPNNMEICFWDKENQIMFFCISEGGSQKATTVRRSFQIIGNLTVKENDENFTLCEGANYVDCQTDSTGADLLVQDDIEAQSIYANENINATGNLSLGQKIVFTLGEIIDNIVDGWIRITGNLNVTGNATFNERVGIGTNSPSAKLFIDGNTDEIQTIIQAYSSQTSDIFVIEESDGTDIISLDRYGHFYFKPVTDSDGISVDGGNINARNLLRLKSFNEQDDTSDAGILSIEHEKSSGLIGNITSINIDMITTESGSGYNLKGMNIVMNNDANSIGLRIEDTETEIEFADTIANIRISNILNFDSNTFVINASSNRIGIGTTTPDEILHLFGNSAALKLEDDSGNDATINVGNSQLTLSADPDNAIASTDIVFKMDGSEVARFYQGGNFGIGTSTTGGDGQLSLGADSEEGCFRYNSNKDSLEFSHQCDNNFSLISDAGFYGSLHWIATANCAVGTAGGFTSPTTFTADSDCDDNARTSRGLTTSNLAVGNAEGRKPQIKFDSLPAGYYNVILHGNFRGTATDVDCSYMMTIDSGAINSSLTGMTAAAGSAGMSPVVSALLYVPTDRGASTIELYGGESAANCRIQITSTELEITVYYYPQYNSTTGADYAEWFEKENELILAGDLIGLNVETGKVRVWRYADPIVGIASNNPSVAGNYKPGIENTHALVGLVGQLDLNEPRIIIKESVVYSPDGQFIGYKLSNGRVFIK